MNQVFALALQVALIAGFATAAGAQSTRLPFQPRLLPGCALPAPKLIAAAAPVDVKLKVAVAPSGSVLRADVVKGSGDSALDAAFLKAALACRFAAIGSGRVDAGSELEAVMRFRLDAGVLPIGIHGCFPVDYPPRAQNRGEEGMTGIRFFLPAGDAAPQVKLAVASGSAVLDEAALTMASTCLSQPGVRGELAADRWYSQNIMWVLR